MGFPVAVVKNYSFTVVLLGVTELTFELTDALYEAGCDDGSVFSEGIEVAIDFDREAPSYEEAVESAKRDISSAGYIPGEVRAIEDEDAE